MTPELKHRILGPLLILLLCPLGLADRGFAEEEAQPGDTIAWAKDLPTAFAEGKTKQLPILVCINAKYVSGKKQEEPAARGLRDVIYRSPEVVQKSRGFVCALLTRGGTSADHGELRALGIEGLIVSPQHIFVHPDGEKILLRKQYWSHGKGPSGIKALLGMMDSAKAKLGGGTEDVPEAPPEPRDGPVDPESDGTDPDAAPLKGDGQAEARAEWIHKMLTKVDADDPDARQTALKSLVKYDQDGDCINPLIERVPKNRKHVLRLIDLVRALGIPELGRAVTPIAKHLKHKDETVRGHVAVTLEYIGHKDAVRALKRAVDKEDNERIANHMYRAIGRCAPADAKVRALLIKKTLAGRSTFATYGPLIGLAYSEKDAKTARAVEKEFKKVGHPFGGRSSSRGTFKRALFMWTLSEITDPKSGPWIRKRKMEPLENVESQYKAFVLGYYAACANKCEGDTEADTQEVINKAMGRYLGWRSDRDPLQDEYRMDRDQSKFKPKMEFEALDEDN